MAGRADFLEKAGAAIADAVGAGGVAFWRAGDEDRGTVIPVAVHGSAPPAEASALDERLLAAGDAEPFPDAGLTGGVWRAGDVRLGAVCAYAPATQRGFTSDDTVLLRTLGHAVGNVYQRLAEEEQRHAAERRLDMMLDASQALNSTLDPDQLVETLVVRAMTMVGCAIGIAGLRRPEGIVARRCFIGERAVTIDYC